jgi:DNA methylase
MILQGDSLIVLKDFPDNSIDSIVTDPPYGLSFMNKKWDYSVPNVELWKEVLRVLKPGGHLLSFGGTRTYHRMVCAIEDAGFEIRDQIQWLYGSGFPKSHNLKDEFKGWGTALKPANEPIVLARKPLEKGLTVAENVSKWGVGALNIDGTRIATTDNLNGGAYSGDDRASQNGDIMKIVGEVGEYKQPTGRWPSNVLLDETAAEMLDLQSGPCKTGIITRPPTKDAEAIIKGKKPMVTASHVDTTSGASRFFYVAKASKRERNAGLEGMPMVLAGAISGKETRPDRPPNHTLRQNHHPTVKPIKLMQYLIKLITPPGGVVLDPFMGSGSTGVAAKSLGFEFIGIELDPEYIKIAQGRINKL